MADFTLDDARAIAREAHAGQLDKLDVDYMEHVEAVAGALIDFDLDIQIAGMLHDVVEDSNFTIDDLRARGVSERALAAIALVSNNLGSGDYLDHIEVICTSADATAVKIADNLHNMRADRVQALVRLTGEDPDTKYDVARDLLWEAADPADLETILWRVEQETLLERWSEEGFEPRFEILDEYSHYGAGGFVDYVLNAVLQLMPDGRVYGRVYGDVQDEFIADWPDDETGQAAVLADWDALVEQYKMPDEDQE